MIKFLLLSFKVPHILLYISVSSVATIRKFVLIWIIQLMHLRFEDFLVEYSPLSQIGMTCSWMSAFQVEGLQQV